MEVTTAWEDSRSALYNAVKSKDVEKVKYLLDRGVDPNLEGLTSKSRKQLLEWPPIANTNGNEKCIVLLLEYGADPYLYAWELVESTYHIIQLYYSIFGLSPPSLKLPIILLAYICIYEAAGVNTVSSSSVGKISINSVLPEIRRCQKIFYEKCLQDIETLKKHEIRENLTMFTIVYKTGRKLIELLNEEDCKIIDSFIADYEKEMTLNIYYLNALRGHMEQMRKLIACKNAAMLVISASTEVLTPFLVLNKIVSYLSYEDLFKFL